MMAGPAAQAIAASVRAAAAPITTRYLRLISCPFSLVLRSVRASTRASETVAVAASNGRRYCTVTSPLPPNGGQPATPASGVLSPLTSMRQGVEDGLGAGHALVLGSHSASTSSGGCCSVWLGIATSEQKRLSATELSEP